MLDAGTVGMLLRSNSACEKVWLKKGREKAGFTEDEVLNLLICKSSLLLTFQQHVKSILYLLYEIKRGQS